MFANSVSMNDLIYNKYFKYSRSLPGNVFVGTIIGQQNNFDIEIIINLNLKAILYHIAYYYSQLNTPDIYLVT